MSGWQRSRQRARFKFTCGEELKFELRAQILAARGLKFKNIRKERE
ncbi:hypothetical protein [uncultured Campylobacter sp.]|nr:hypothetical protein [uncultured Campylobacter sp.]